MDFYYHSHFLFYEFSILRINRILGEILLGFALKIGSEELLLGVILHYKEWISRTHIVIGVEHSGNVLSQVPIQNSLDVIPNID